MEVLNFITNPNVAYLLLVIGFYGIFFELINPGYYAPGVIGIICLLLATYALQLLPVNYIGVSLVLLGIGFSVAELFFTSGALAIGGLIAFITGSMMLFDKTTGLRVSLELILAIAVLNIVFFVWVLGMALKARNRPITAGSEALIGQTAQALEDFEKEGWIIVNGERWRATSESPIQKDSKLKIVERNGLLLKVTQFRKGTHRV